MYFASFKTEIYRPRAEKPLKPQNTPDKKPGYFIWHLRTLHKLFYLFSTVKVSFLNGFCEQKLNIVIDFFKKIIFYARTRRNIFFV